MEATELLSVPHSFSSCSSWSFDTDEAASSGGLYGIEVAVRVAQGLQGNWTVDSRGDLAYW